MSGITDAPFRRQVSALGAGLVVSEMTACAALVRGKPEAKLRAGGAGRRPPMWSSLPAARPNGWRRARGSRPMRAPTSSTSTWVVPARHVTNGYSGSALMRDLDNAVRLIEATIAATAVPVTLKMRLGWDDRPTMPRNWRAARKRPALQWSPFMAARAASFSPAHADWAAVRPVAEAVSHSRRHQRRHRIL